MFRSPWIAFLLPFVLVPVGCNPSVSTTQPTRSVEQLGHDSDKIISEDEVATPPIAVEQTAKNATNRVKALLEENRKLRGELAALREEKKTSKLVTPKSGDLVVLKNTIKKIDKDGNSSLEGVVVNRTHLKMVNVNIHFNCLDQEGFRIGDVFSAVETLDPGEQWKFRTTSLEDNTASWKFQRLEGYKAGEFFATAHAGKEE